tara:strand:+ start:1981 stop:2643 length:663 start_codon:yes stop_codon:yes gene_type:complete
MIHTSFRNPEFNNSPAFVIHQAFSKELCEKIIENYKDKTETAKHQQGDKMVPSGEEGAPRKSEVCWVKDDVLFQQTADMMRIANHVAGWDFKITGQEDLQFTKYEGEGKYDWHIDGWSDATSKRKFDFNPPKNLMKTNFPNLIDTTRKLSCSVLLNDDFSGGEFDTAYLDVDPLEIKKQEIKPKQGDMIFFPSYLAHRVRPIRVGTRYSLVVWFAGPPLT